MIKIFLIISLIILIIIKALMPLATIVFALSEMSDKKKKLYDENNPDVLNLSNKNLLISMGEHVFTLLVLSITLQQIITLT